MRSLLVLGPLAFGAMFAACSSENTVIIHGGGDGGATMDDGGTSDGDGGTGSDGGMPGVDSGPGYKGGPLSCAGIAAVVNNYMSCGTERWAVKVGEDAQAGAIVLTATASTITALTALNGGVPYNNPPQSSRVSPTEKSVVFLKDVTVVFSRLENDSDYHLGIQDSTFRTMIAEIPYPGGAGVGCVSGSWECLVSRARAATDKALAPTSTGRNPGVIATIVGVPFYDFSHMQAYEAPNSIELHPVLAICFGKGCTPGL